MYLNMYLKTKNLTTIAYKITTPFTDHYPLFLTFDEIIHSDTRKQNNKTINYKKLINIASSIDWNSILTIQNPNSASVLLVELVNGCVKKATFALKQNKQKNMVPRNIWITNAIIISCKTKETLYIFKRNHPNSEFAKK